MDSTICDLSRSRHRTSAAALLDTWAAHAWSDGVRVDCLAALDRIAVHTRNSTYEIIVTAPSTAEVLVRGGAFFREFTRATLAGSSLGGSFLKLHGIYVGFCMELAAGRQSIVTSAVRSVVLPARNDASQPPM